MNIKEIYEAKRMEQAPTLLSRQGFRILKIILVITQMHVETLAIFAFVKWLCLSFFWTVEIVIGCVLIFQFITKPLWNGFHNMYMADPVEPAHIREIEERVRRTVVVKEAVQ